MWPQLELWLRNGTHQLFWGSAQSQKMTSNLSWNSCQTWGPHWNPWKQCISCCLRSSGQDANAVWFLRPCVRREWLSVLCILVALIINSLTSWYVYNVEKLQVLKATDLIVALRYQPHRPITPVHLYVLGWDSGWDFLQKYSSTQCLHHLLLSFWNICCSPQMIINDASQNY